MPGVARNETVSTSNPLLWFGYQELGKLKDIAAAGSLAFRVVDETVTPEVEKVARTTLVLATAKFGTGRYAASFATSAATWNVGTHRIEWFWRVASATEVEKRMIRRFEVLDETVFGRGAEFTSYVDTSDLNKVDELAGRGVSALQLLAQSASLRAETYTGRFFEPRYAQVHVDFRAAEGPRLVSGIPIVALEAVERDDGTILTAIDMTSLAVYNRHLRGLIDPDDRDHPRIEFLVSIAPGAETGSFVRGMQGYRLTGVFGYTEPDQSPMGNVPYDLARVVSSLAVREALDPTLSDIFGQPGRLRSVRTRDQSATFAPVSSSGLLSGDPGLDAVLVRYLRPPHMLMV